MTAFKVANTLSDLTLDDDEELEDEILVHVEFDCDIDPSLLSSDSAFKIIGIDSENPLMQLGSKVYQGEWRDIIGTAVFLEDDDEKRANQSNIDPLFYKPIENPLKFACCTRKSLVMSRVFVKAKADKSQEDTTENNTNNACESDELTEVKPQNEDTVVENNQSTEQMDTT